MCEAGRNGTGSAGTERIGTMSARTEPSHVHAVTFIETPILMKMVPAVRDRTSFTLNHKHTRAICDEIGVRLGAMSRQLPELPARIKQLLVSLREHDRHQAPPLAPVSEETEADPAPSILRSLANR